MFELKKTGRNNYVKNMSENIASLFDKITLYQIKISKAIFSHN